MTEPGATDAAKAEGNKLEGYQQVFLGLLGLFGCLVVWGAMTQVVESVRLSRFGLETRGVVVEHEASSSTTAKTVSHGPRSTIVFRPIVAIETPDGKARIRGLTWEGLERVPPIGARVPVLYLPGSPEDGLLKSDVRLSWIYLLTAIVGLAMAGAPVGVFFATRTWKLPARWVGASRGRTE